jgi:hypothetical protein
MAPWDGHPQAVAVQTAPAPHNIQLENLQHDWIELEKSLRQLRHQAAGSGNTALYNELFQTLFD